MVTSSDGHEGLPAPEEVEDLVSALSFEERELLRDAVEHGEPVRSSENAGLAVALARIRKRQVSKRELPIYILLTVGLAGGLGLGVEGNASLFVFLLLFGGLVAVGGGWWAATWRPLDRAERVNLETLHGEHAFGNTPKKRSGRVYDWFAAAGLAWIVVFAGGVLASFFVNVPTWTGFPAFVLTVALLRWLIGRWSPKLTQHRTRGSA